MARALLPGALFTPFQKMNRMIKLLQAIFLVGCFSGYHALTAQNLIASGEDAYLEALYLHLHQHPELSFHEKETSARMAAELRNIGFEVTENVGGYGVVGVLKNGKGPTLLIRTDMDALPVKETTGATYASTVITTDDAGNDVGVMHACGHDMHMTVWTGTARWMAEHKKEWQGTLLMIGQPAEERGSGAREMLKDGLYARFPKPELGLALHCNATLAAGMVGVCPGYAMANVDMVDITVYGQGGHGAYPHTTKDPVVLAARIITDLQTIVSREISPLEPAVVTVGSIHGGSKGNIIPSEVKLELTLRSYTDEVRAALIEKIKRTCNGAAMGYGLPEDKYPKVVVREEFTPALRNDPVLTTRMETVFKQQLGESQVRVLGPVMGGEDFSRYGRTEDKIPIMLFWLGTIPAEKAAAAERKEIELPSLHNDSFLPEYPLAIKTGVSAMTAAALSILAKK